MRFVVLGLSLSSAWGNGHATTFRALLAALHARGHEILFLERDTPWYAAHRDLVSPAYCDLQFYGSLGELADWREAIRTADVVIVGSYVPDGRNVSAFVQETAQGLATFYDIDTPVTLRAVEDGTCGYLSAELIPGFQIYWSFTGGPTLDDLERGLGSPAARPLYCAVDAKRYHPRPVPKRWDLSYLGTYSVDRQPGLDRLLLEAARALPSKRFVVAGPQYPADITWPDNVVRIEHIPPDEHADFYSASRATLNITRADMVLRGWSPSVRLFEAAACGVPIISDVWDGLDALFAPEREILFARRTEDVLSALNRDDLVSIGAAGRARVLQAHTAAHRAKAMEDDILEAFDRQNRRRRA